VAIVANLPVVAAYLLTSGACRDKTIASGFGARRYSGLFNSISGTLVVAAGKESRMRNFVKCIALGAVLAVASGCATTIPQGGMRTGVSLPVAVTANEDDASKKGTSSCSSVLALFAFGDCSVDKAAKDGGITEIHHVDWGAKNFLGIYGSYTLTVYGN
jgi:hypothetical protein